MVTIMILILYLEIENMVLSQIPYLAYTISDKKPQKELRFLLGVVLCAWVPVPLAHCRHSIKAIPWVPRSKLRLTPSGDRTGVINWLMMRFTKYKLFIPYKR
jgi:hypothetical protein